MADFQADSGHPISFIYLTNGGYKEGIDFAKGDAYGEFQTSRSFREAWRDVRARELEVEWFYPGDDAGTFLSIGSASFFFAGAEISPSRFSTFADQFETCHFTFSAQRCDLRWSDWVSRFISLQSFSTLTSLSFALSRMKPSNSSLPISPSSASSTSSRPSLPSQPSPLTLACSSECYQKLSLTHPSLHRDSELVGGYLSIWSTSFELNFARVKRLGPCFDT